MPSILSPRLKAEGPSAFLRAACLVLLVETFGSLPAEAQICAGRSSFNLAATHFALDAGVNGSGRAIGVSAGHGTDALFGIATGTAQTVDRRGSVYVIAATIGTDQTLTPDNRLHVCPLIILGYESDPNGATGNGGRAGVSAAADAALMVVNTPKMRVAPTIGVDLRSRGVSRMAGRFGQVAGRHYFTFSAGIGFVIWNRLSVVPRVAVPFGPVDQSAVQMTVGYNLPRR